MGASASSGRTVLAGTELCSAEIAGTLDVARARALAGPGLDVYTFDRGGGGDAYTSGAGAEIELLAFRMSRLGPRGARWLGADYGEVLFRLGVVWAGERAWLAVRCALDRAPVAALAAALIRYPIARVRHVDVAPGEAEWRVSAEDHRGNVLLASLSPTGALTEPAPVRPVLVRAGERLMRVPWEETPASAVRAATVKIEPSPLELDALGAHATWKSAVVHEGRQHRCGIAWPV